MKRTTALWIVVLLLSLSLTAQASGFTVDDDGVAQGSFDYKGHEITIDGIIDVDFPSPLSEVQLVGAGLSEKQILEAAKSSFQMAPGSHDTLLHKGATYKYGRGLESVGSYRLPFRSVYPVTDQTLQARLNECYTFCDLLNIEYSPISDHALYFLVKRPGGLIAITPEAAKLEDNVYVAIKIPIMIDGLPISPVLGEMGALSGSSDDVIINSPWVSIAFDSEGRFESAMVSFYNVASAQQIQGDTISWMEAVTIALDDAFETMQKPQSMESFFSEFEIRISRVQAVWRPNWSAVLRPGFYVKFDIFDKATGEYVSPSDDRYNMSTTAVIDAITGLMK